MQQSMTVVSLFISVSEGRGEKIGKTKGKGVRKATAGEGMEGM